MDLIDLIIDETIFRAKDFGVWRRLKPAKPVDKPIVRRIK